MQLPSHVLGVNKPFYLKFEGKGQPPLFLQQPNKPFPSTRVLPSDNRWHLPNLANHDCRMLPIHEFWVKKIAAGVLFETDEIYWQDSEQLGETLPRRLLLHHQPIERHQRQQLSRDQGQRPRLQSLVRKATEDVLGNAQVLGWQCASFRYWTGPNH